MIRNSFQSCQSKDGTSSWQAKGVLQQKINGKPYSEGDLVWLCSPVVHKDRGRKLHLHVPWTRPYKMIGWILEVTYCIQHISSRKRHLIIHFDCFKPCPSNVCIPLSGTPFVSALPPSLPLPQEPTCTKFDVTLLPPVDPPSAPLPLVTLSESPKTRFLQSCVFPSCRMWDIFFAAEGANVTVNRLYKWNTILSLFLYY